MPHVRYDDEVKGGRRYPSVLWLMTPKTGEFFHMTDNGMELLDYKLADSSMRARIGMREGEWMVKGLLSDEEEEVDVAALFDEVKGYPVKAWRTVIDNRLRHDNHTARHICGNCEMVFDGKGWQHRGEEWSSTHLKAREACKGCEGIHYIS